MPNGHLTVYIRTKCNLLFHSEPDVRYINCLGLSTRQFYFAKGSVTVKKEGRAKKERYEVNRASDTVRYSELRDQGDSTAQIPFLK